MEPETINEYDVLLNFRIIWEQYEEVAQVHIRTLQRRLNIMKEFYQRIQIQSKSFELVYSTIERHQRQLNEQIIASDMKDYYQLLDDAIILLAEVEKSYEQVRIINFIHVLL